MPGKKNQPKLFQEELLHQLDLRRAGAQSQLSANYHPKSLPPASEKCKSRPVSGPVVVKHTVIHNFTKEIRIRQEVKVVESQPVVTTRRIQAPQVPPKPKQTAPKREAADRPNAAPQVEVHISEYASNTTPAEAPAKPKQLIEQIQVYKLGDVYNGRRVLMEQLGIDVGTKTIVIAFKSGEETQFISEINGYYPFERCTPFIKNMLDDPKKVRSDGTKRPARWFELDGKAIVLGKDAEEFAYAKNDTMLRPMAEGGISADEEAMTVLGAIVQGLMKMAEEEIGTFSEEVKICYCTTAPAINAESNIDYHERVVNLVIEGYETEASCHIIR